jgi:type IV pilus assembly protein PilO
MEKLYALIQKTPMVQKAAILGILLAMIGAGHYFLIYTDQEKDLKKLDRQLAKLEEELQEKQEIAGNLSKFKKRVEFLEQKLEEKKKNLPDDANMDQLLKTLNELSEKSDIRIMKFTPLPEVRRNFYAEIPVNMEIEGNYHEIATFFDKVSKEERIINISNIELAKPEERSGKIVLSAACMAKTFRALPAELKKAGEKGKKKKKKRRGRGKKKD